MQACARQCGARGPPPHRVAGDRHVRLARLVHLVAQLGLEVGRGALKPAAAPQRPRMAARLRAALYTGCDAPRVRTREWASTGLPAVVCLS